MSSKYKLGSEWRKWDLHVHTPCSINQNYGGDTIANWEKFIQDLERLPECFKVIGINDYIFLDGYKKILEYQGDGRLKNLDLILPVIELRIDKFGSVGDEAWKRVNFHIIFSNEIAAETIEQQFLNAIQHSIKLSSEHDNHDFSGVITKESLQDLGKKIKDSSSVTIPGSDIKIGFNNITYNYEKIKKALDSTYFKDKYLTAVGKTEWDAMRWDSSIADKKTIINEANFVFTSSSSIENFYKAKDKLKEQRVNDNLLDCSDAHCWSSQLDSNSIPIKDRIGKCFTWIKTDSIFEGLKQIIYEPEDRVFIGENPEIFDRIKNNKNKYIKALSINKKDGTTVKNNGKWFENIKIDFNPELVAIIGNKGSGKSAIADILGLGANSKMQANFSFLDKKRFSQQGFGNCFEARMEWQDDNVKDFCLSDKVDTNTPELIRYLPQRYFEEITNEIEEIKFENTLKDIIFSHIPQSDRLGENTFNELVAHKTYNVEQVLEQKYKEIRDISKEIIKLEKKAHKDYLKKIENLLDEKKKEIETHKQNKENIEEKQKPSDDMSEEKKDELNKIETINQDIENIKIEIVTNQSSLNQMIINNEELKQMLNSIVRFEDEMQKYKNTNQEIYKKYNLDIDEIISLKINKQLIENKTKDLSKQILLIQEKLKKPLDLESVNISNEEICSLYMKHYGLEKEKKELEDKLSKPYQEYQKYQQELKEWEDKEKSLIGDKETSGTLVYYENIIDYIKNNLSDEINNKYDKIIEISSNIFDCKKEILDFYNNFKDSVDSHIQKDVEFLKKFKMAIEVTLKRDINFEKNFLSFINLRKLGYFQGKEEAEEKTRAFFDGKNLNEIEDIKNMLRSIIDSFKGEEEEKRSIIDQAKDEKISELYEYIFSLKYLEPIYELRLNDTSLSQLSPGEKGTLLLVFYLSVDKNDCPLVIDQPEDNLDNKSVYEILTHYIKFAKKQRQIIIVTHNPNIAVGADAEQIIYVEIDKKDSYRFSYESGSIENSDINRRIVEILEGTQPAFDKRKLKYIK